VQCEVVEECGGRSVERGTAGRFAVADDVDPAARLERLDDLGRHDHAANVLDLAAGDRLPGGNDRQVFHHGARVARRLFREQLVEVGLQLGAGLETPAAGKGYQLD